MDTVRLSHIVICAVGLMLSGLLAGCSPEYDWRVVSLGDGHIRAMLPAKPHVSEREIEFEGHALTFVLTSASVDGVLFTVGYAALPEALQDDAAARGHLVQQTQASLYRNLNVAPPDTWPIEGKHFTIVGSGQGKALQLEAMVWTTQHALIEGIVIGATDTLPPLQVAEFLRELAPGARPD